MKGVPCPTGPSEALSALFEDAAMRHPVRVARDIGDPSKDVFYGTFDGDILLDPYRNAFLCRRFHFVLLILYMRGHAILESPSAARRVQWFVTISIYPIGVVVNQDEHRGAVRERRAMSGPIGRIRQGCFVATLSIAASPPPAGYRRPVPPKPQAPRPWR